MTTESVGDKVRVAVFGSGAGSTARCLIEASKTACYQVVVVVGSKPGIGLEYVARENDVPYELLCSDDKHQWDNLLHSYQIDVMALAGWLRMIPVEVIEQYPSRILNIHPSLLPAYGGKGMYGRRVHQAVFDAGEQVSGVTIHIVTPLYDEGPIIAQQQCDVSCCRTPDEVEQTVRAVEKALYPNELHRFCSSMRIRDSK
jgi:phosphoribosylglycinamide formyltransferase-1